MEMAVQMTGRQRRDYEQWRTQQDEADRERLSRAQSDSGHWRREWDTEKKLVLDFLNGCAIPTRFTFSLRCSDRHQHHGETGDGHRNYRTSYRDDRHRQRGGGRNDQFRRKPPADETPCEDEEQWPSLADGMHCLTILTVCIAWLIVNVRLVVNFLCCVTGANQQPPRKHEDRMVKDRLGKKDTPHKPRGGWKSFTLV